MDLVKQPAMMSTNLYPHQLSAIYMMELREAEKKIDRHSFNIECNVGIYSDIAGFGKTLTVLGLLCRDAMPWDMNEDYVHQMISSVYGHGTIVKKTLMRFKKIKTNLIVASTSILKQWCEEIRKSGLRSILITHKKKVDSLDVSDYDIVIIIPSLYNYLLERFPSYAWKRFIYDEPTQTKIPAMRQIIAGFIWFVTATPNQMLFFNRNNQNFLNSLFSNCTDYNLFKHLIIKNEDDFVRKSFALPEICHKYHECYQIVFKVVKNLISENISQMISAGNIEKAVKMLGGDATDNIIDLIETEKNQLIQEAEVKIQKYMRLHDEARLSKWENRRDELKNQLAELKKRFSDYLKIYNCNICLGSFDKPVLVGCCQNVFCGSCLLTWLKQHSNCPLCRKTIKTNMIHYVRVDDPTNGKTNEPPVRNKTKQETIIDIIKENPSHKYIIFSNYDETFNTIRDALFFHDLSFTEIYGNCQTRTRQIDNFKNGDIQVLFMNSYQNGAGINLQIADQIILYHKMTEDIEIQIIGRAYRVGRVKPLTVHHLI